MMEAEQAMGAQHYDLIVIGGGPAGYAAAIRAAQHGMRVACVDDRARLGGTCLNIGCIPSKALLHFTARYHEAETSFRRQGIVLEKIGFDLDAMMSRKEESVGTLTKGISQLFHKHDVHHVRGWGCLTPERRIEVRTPDGASRSLDAQHVIVATGSAPVALSNAETDETRVLSSEGALSLPEVPEHLVVVGGGYIGLEMGSVWGRLGARVTCVEMTERLIPTMDGEHARELQKVLERQGFRFRLENTVTHAKVDEKAVSVGLRSGAQGEEESLSCSHVLVAVGRRPYTEGLGLAEAGVSVDDHGFVNIDRRFQTTREGVYAVGDVVRGPMLAHKARDEALACVDGIAGAGGHVNYEAIPAIIYTSPEVAAVGHTEEALQEQGIPYRTGRFPFRANSRARCIDEPLGFVKILAHAETDLILGAHLLGPEAGTVIHEIVTAMELGGSAEELARTCHAHPTFNEAVQEAALAVHERTIHI